MLKACETEVLCEVEKLTLSEIEAATDTDCELLIEADVLSEIEVATLTDSEILTALDTDSDTDADIDKPLRRSFSICSLMLTDNERASDTDVA